MKKSFKQFLLTEAITKKSIETEAMVVLRKIIDMVDDGHVDYNKNKISFNIGKLIHDKKYSNLELFIVKSDNEDIKIGRHAEHEKHAIFITTVNLPNRQDIDEFLIDKERATKFKVIFTKFIHDADIDNTNDIDGTSLEKSKKLNTREEFESLYRSLVEKLNVVLGKYIEAKKSIESKIQKASYDMGEREILKASADKLKKNMLGSSFEEFKRKAIEIMGQEKYKMLNKEYREKLESRLHSFYEHKNN